MVGEALGWGEVLFLAMGLVAVDRGDGIDHPGAFAGEEFVDLDELSPSMDQAA